MSSTRAAIDGVAIGPLALGTWTFAGDSIWGDSDAHQCERVVHAALDAGVVLFDTAPNYGDGRSEEILGRALAGRTEALIATKIKVDGLDPVAIRDSVISSLERLGRDRIDLMQIHWPPDSPARTIEAIEAFDALRREGLVRAIGACNFGPYDLADAETAPLASNQLPYSLLWRAIEWEAAAATDERGLVTIAYSPLQQGLLGGSYRSLEHYPAGRKRTRLFDSGTEELLATTLDALHGLATAWQRPLLELALAFVRVRPCMDTVLVGARSVEQLTSVRDAVQSSLSADEQSKLESVTNDLKLRMGPSIDMFRGESRVRYTTEDRLPRRYDAPLRSSSDRFFESG